jgi:hypothetical protein
VSFVRKIKAGLVRFPTNQFVGEEGTIFYDPAVGDLFLSDGVTPGGIPMGTGGGGTGPRGYTGSQGENGINGYTGSIGPVGYTGSASFQALELDGGSASTNYIADLEIDGGEA